MLKLMATTVLSMIRLRTAYSKRETPLHQFESAPPQPASIKATPA